MSYAFVLGHIYLWGVREAEGTEMVCQEPSQQTNISHLSQQRQASDLCAGGGWGERSEMVSTDGGTKTAT